MKNIFALILALCCVIAVFVSCSNSQDEGSQTEESVSAVTSQENTNGTETSKTTSSTAKTTQKSTTALKPSEPDIETCFYMSCDNPVSGDPYYSDYCEEHKCNMCYNQKAAGNDLYCNEHECNAGFCENPALDDYNYCSEHKCSEQRCNSERVGNSDYCGIHD